MGTTLRPGDLPYGYQWTHWVISYLGSTKVLGGRRRERGRYGLRSLNRSCDRYRDALAALAWALVAYVTAGAWYAAQRGQDMQPRGAKSPHISYVAPKVHHAEPFTAKVHAIWLPGILWSIG